MRKTIGLNHDDVLLINFTTTPHSHALFARFFHLPCWYSFQISILWEHICILNARLGGEIDQQNVIMQKAYYMTANTERAFFGVLEV